MHTFVISLNIFIDNNRKLRITYLEFSIENAISIYKLRSDARIKFRTQVLKFKSASLVSIRVPTTEFKIQNANSWKSKQNDCKTNPAKGIAITLSWPPTSQTVKLMFLYSTVSTLKPA